LPEFRRQWVRQANRTRCPLCKGPLIRTADKSYRVGDTSIESAPNAPPSHHSLRLAGIAASLLAALLTAGLLMALRSPSRGSLTPSAGEIAQSSQKRPALPAPVEARTTQTRTDQEPVVKEPPSNPQRELIAPPGVRKGKELKEASAVAPRP